MKFFFRISFVLLFATIIASCSKDKQIVKQLDGKWKVTSSTDTTVDLTLVQYTYTFEKCNDNKADCDGFETLTASIFGYPLSISVNFTWHIDNEIIYLTNDSGGIYQYKFLEHSDSHMKVQDLDSDFVTDFEKVN